jgi:glycosyltransferase involved in cell wall biosynthesis
MAVASGYEGRIHFLGFRPDIPQVLQGFDVLVHSSIQPEPLGTVVLEGMAQCLAIVASNEGGPREMIRDGVDGILVPPGDPDALAQAIEHLAQQPDRARRMGLAARERFETVFTGPLMADGLASLYREALQE